MPKRSLTTLAAVTAVVAFAVYGTFAAWTATTSNTGNSIESGDIGIADDDTGQAMFEVTGLEPGDSLVRCIEVSNTGTIGFSSLKLYSSPSSGGLQEYLDVTVDRGTGDTTFPDCAGFSVTDAGIFDDTLDQFPTTAVSAIAESGDPAAGWAAGGAKVYRVTATLPSDTPNESAGQSASFGLVWDAEVN